LIPVLFGRILKNITLAVASFDFQQGFFQILLIPPGLMLLLKNVNEMIGGGKIVARRETCTYII